MGPEDKHEDRGRGAARRPTGRHPQPWCYASGFPDWDGLARVTVFNVPSGRSFGCS